MTAGTASLLLELGCEELPASFARIGQESFGNHVAELLRQARIAHGSMRTLATPRRIALIVDEVALAQAPLDEELVGPAKNIAYDAGGKLTQAGEGFLRKQGLTAADARLGTTPKGEYLIARRRDPGKATAEVLRLRLPDALARVAFPKSMRWDDQNASFGRPIRWLVALLGAEIVPFEYAGVVAGRRTQGHRFLADGPVDVSDAAHYVQQLERVHVVADVDVRRTRIVEQLTQAARAVGGEYRSDNELLEEALFLVEEPTAICGGFDRSYLALPPHAIVAVMRGHQRYFAIQDASDSLLPHYLTVVNTARNPENIRRGNDRVLRARLEDARFFVEEDLRVPLESRVAKLDGITFQAKLGSVGDKVRRVAGLAEVLRVRHAPSVASAKLALAAQLAKVDLTTLLVGELPELQGTMGHWYARKQGIDADVAEALEEHYRPRHATDGLAGTPLSNLLALADRLDTLVGCFGVGIVPTGSADPFALRRAALAVIRIAFETTLDVDLSSALKAAYEGYPSGKLTPWASVCEALDDFVRGRLRSYFTEGYRSDVVDACLGAWSLGSVKDLARRLEALTRFRGAREFAQLIEINKRVSNITKATLSADFAPASLVEPAERTLAEALQHVRGAAAEQLKAQDYEAVLRLVVDRLSGPIAEFFERVFVMAEDATIRENRLRLLKALLETLTSVARLEQLEAGETLQASSSVT